MTKNFKTFLFWVVLIIGVLSVIEAASYVACHIMNRKFPFFDLKELTLDEHKIAQVSEQWDKDLGWDMHYETQWGERPRVTDYHDVLITTFGDSFIHCDEVQDNETWQTYLVKQIGKDVLNFGVVGFGPGQTYLKFLKVYPRIKSKVVVFGIFQDGIYRMVNNYRPFLSKSTGIPLTKPRFFLDEQGQLELAPNPIQHKMDLTQLKSEKFLKTIGKDDRWYNTDWPRLEFPYMKNLWNAVFLRSVFKQTTGEDEVRFSWIDWLDLWKSPQTQSILFAIADAFVEKTESYDAIPVFIVLPQVGMVVNSYLGEPVRTDVFMDYCRERGYFCFDGTGAMAQVMKQKQIQDFRYFYLPGNHLSSEGNRVLAEKFYHFLKAQHIIGM